MADDKKPIKMQLPNKKTLSKMAQAKGTVTGDGGGMIGKSTHPPMSPPGTQMFGEMPLGPLAALAKGDTVYFPLTKAGQSIGGGLGVTVTQPMFFSPIHTPQNWQIAQKRREVTQWCRFYYENEPKVAAAIDFYSQFPINGFKLECKKKKVLKYFERLIDKLDLLRWLRLISHERFMIGDVFIFLEVECPHCHGSGTDPDNPEEPCMHPDGSFKRIIVLNPDWIEVQSNVLADEPEITLLPDDELKKIVQTRQPKAIYERLPDAVKALIAAGKPIRLSNTVTSHLKHGGTPYGTYGESILRRLFTTLAYKTKLMTANWIIAERLILPIRVVKVGEKDRPASEDDIADIVQQLAAVANDPNLTIVTHHAFEYEWFGASGKIHNITAELEMIGKEILDGLMLNQALLNGEMGAYCHSEDTLTLTDSGFKKWDEINENDKIACFNPDSHNLEYHNYTAKHVYDYSGDMVHFQTDKIDICVTPNHRMWTAPRDSDEFAFTEAKDVKRRASFIGSVDGFDGEKQDGISIGEKYYSMSDYCELAGLFVSEGSTSKEKRKNRKNQTSTLHIHQNSDGKARQQIESLFARIFDTGYSTENTLSIYKPELAHHFREAYGCRAENKMLPSWLKNLDTKYLNILIDSMVAGDGTVAKEPNRKVNGSRYFTSSEILANDFAEIAFKCGYSTKITKRGKIGPTGNKNARGHEYITRHQQYVVHISKGFKGRKPTLQSKSGVFEGKEIQRIPYSGKTYCFTVPTGLFVTMRNGKITIQGNSSAQIGAETMIMRLDVWRAELKNWVEKHIFLPIAKMRGFIDEDESKEVGERVYLYPTLKWEDMRLRDNTNDKQMAIQLNQNGKISDRTLLEKYFDLNYDQEIEQMREEQVMAQQNGMVQGGAPGGGGMGAPGGGAGGAGGPMGGPGGAPGGPMGDMGGGMGGPAGSPAGAPMGGVPMGGGAGAAPPMGAAAGGGKVYKKGKAPKSEEPSPEELAASQPVPIRLTKPEAKLYRLINEMRLPFGVFAQYKQQVPGNQQPFAMDFAIPDLHLDIEADGEHWHNNPEDKKSDNERDIKLANVGWTVIRFPESALNENIQQVQKVLEETIMEAAKASKQNRKQASVQGENTFKVVYYDEKPGLSESIEAGYTSISIARLTSDKEIKEG